MEGQGREWALYPNAATQKGKNEGERRAGWKWVESASVACSRVDLGASNPREALACRRVLTASLDRQGCGFPNSIQIKPYYRIIPGAKTKLLAASCRALIYYLTNLQAGRGAD